MTKFISLLPLVGGRLLAVEEGIVRWKQRRLEYRQSSIMQPAKSDEQGEEFVHDGSCHFYCGDSAGEAFRSGFRPIMPED